MSLKDTPGSGSSNPALRPARDVLARAQDRLAHFRNEVLHRAHAHEPALDADHHMFCSEAVGFDDERSHAGRRARERGGAPGQAAADDDDVSGVLAAKPWMIGTPLAGESVNPGRDAVTCAHADSKCSATRAAP